jgi:hypothetical protein
MRVDEPLIWRVRFPWTVQRYVDKHDGDPFPDEFNYGTGQSFFTFRTDPPPPLVLQAEVRRLGPAQLQFDSTGSGPDIVQRSWYHASSSAFPATFSSEQVSFTKDFAAENPEVPAGSHSQISIFVRDRWGRTAQQYLPFSILKQVGTQGPLSITTFELVRIAGGVAELRAVVENASSSTVTDIGLLGSRAPAGSATSTPANVATLAAGASSEFTVRVPVDELDRFTVEIEAFGTSSAGPVRSGTRTADVEVVPSMPGSTTTSQDVAAGQDRVEVASQAGFDVGDHARIGTGSDAEVRRIGGFGSLIFTAPLGRPHPAGTAVVEIEAPGGDTTGPVITISSPVAGSAVVEGSAATLVYSCADAGVGVESCGGAGPSSGSPLDTATAGVHEVTVRAWDRNGNASAKTVAYRVASLANRRYVDALHDDLLGRAATEAELSTLGVALDRGTLTRTKLASDLTGSLAWATVTVDGLYRDLLDRPVDPSGRAYWAGQIQAGRRTIESVALSLLSSSEHLRSQGGGTRVGWIDALYEQVLGRAPDPSGRAHWIASRATRSKIARSIYLSREARARRVGLRYEVLLGREPTSAERALWTERLLTVGDAGLIRALVTSEEYVARANEA